MFPDLLFLLSLAAKMVVTALFVVGATFAAERAGPLAGAMVATLPISAGPAYLFLSLEHDARFIAASALASLVINAVTCIFALVYAALAQRRGLLASILPAMAVWVVLAVLARAVPWTTGSAIALNVIVLAACLVLGDRFRHVGVPPAIRRWYDIPLRAVLVATLVAIVVGLSTHVGSTITGTLAVFPIVLLSLTLILHPRMGGPATAAVLSNSVLGLVGFAAAALAAHLAIVPLGTPLGLTLALAVSIVCNLAFWTWRRAVK
ncbi:MAG TPA: hypothetical protein VHA77_18255 [Xanthobacteraceae bacterium]|nr:hypothetical protein [Xanthobacteraceae bacterium]